jgi:hypothetical protein
MSWAEGQSELSSFCEDVALQADSEGVSRQGSTKDLCGSQILLHLSLLILSTKSAATYPKTD